MSLRQRFSDIKPNIIGGIAIICISIMYGWSIAPVIIGHDFHWTNILIFSLASVGWGLLMKHVFIDKHDT